MDDRDRQHLGNLIDHAQPAISYARAHGRGWWSRAETLDAVLMRISQVGEAASKTSPEALAEVPGVLMIRSVVSRQLPRLITSVRKALVVDEKQRQRGDTAPTHASPATTRPRRRPPA